MTSFTTLGLYDTDPRLVNLQRFLNEKMKLDLLCDGNMGKITQAALQNWQMTAGFTEIDTKGTCYGPRTAQIVEVFSDHKYLNDDAFVSIAKKMAIPEASVRAVTEVEAKQFGFLASGRPAILFERHKFYKDLVRLRGQSFANSVTASAPDICNSNPGGYVGREGEWKRYDKASNIDTTCAMLSTSWGLFQIMGFNHKQAGFSNVQDYVNAMFESEKKQLEAFASYVKNDSDQSLHRALVTQSWASFANEYNGPAYKKNLYDTKLATAFAKWVKICGSDSAIVQA